jgi:hypothetical protein
MRHRGDSGGTSDVDGAERLGADRVSSGGNDVAALEAAQSGNFLLKPPWEKVVNALASLMSLYYLYVAFAGAKRFEVYLGVYVALTFVLIFLV